MILSQTPAIGAKNRCNPAGNSATPGARVVVSLAVTEKYENGFFYLVHFILSTCPGRDLESTQFFVHSKRRSVPRSLEPRTSICACTMSARDYCVIPSALNYPEWGTAGGISCALTITQAALTQDVMETRWPSSIDLWSASFYNLTAPFFPRTHAVIN